MFVPAPALRTNGEKTLPKGSRTTAWNAEFDTLGEALAYEDASLNFSHLSLGSYRRRQNMQSGRIGRGEFVPTTYHSLALSCDYSEGSKVVFRNKVTGRHFVYYRDQATGYTGGFQTGWGNPWNFFCYTQGSGYAEAIANRAIVDQLDLRARSEILLKARNQKVDLSETLAGLDKTVIMVANKTSQVIRAWNAVRRGNLALAARHLGLNPFLKGSKIKNPSLAEHWLALVYGWWPLLNDIKDGVNLVNNGLQLPESTFMVQRSVKGMLPFARWEINFDDDPWKNPKLRHEVEATVTYKYRLRIKDSYAAYLVSLGLDNPAYLVWVGLPYSFVVDWLAPIGDWLQAVSAPMALQFVAGYKSRHISGYVEQEAGPFRPSFFYGDWEQVYYSGPAKIRTTMVEFDRTRLLEFPTVLPYVRLPSTSPMRIANAIALVKTAKTHRGRL